MTRSSAFGRPGARAFLPVCAAFLLLAGSPVFGQSMAQADFFQLKLYRSSDAVLDAGDTQIGVYAQSEIQIGSPTALAIGSPSVPPSGTEWFYIVSAEMNTQVTDGHAFRVGFAAGGVSTGAGGIGSAVAAADGDRVTVDVVATQLVFTVQPEAAISGEVFPAQPVV